MKCYPWLRTWLFTFILVYSIGQTDSIICSQCNMRLRGVHNTCKSPRIMTNCIGCIKTLTKVKLRDSGYMDGWERMSEVTSRYCMRAGSMGAKPAGCYKQQNNGGYTERCYCYSDNCNSGATRSSLGLFTSSWFSFGFIPVIVVTVLATGRL